MFKIIEGDFKNNKYSDEEYLDNWPMLYILENGRQAYIGESSHVKTRMTQHSSIEEKRIFQIRICYCNYPQAYPLLDRYMHFRLALAFA